MRLPIGGNPAQFGSLAARRAAAISAAWEQYADTPQPLRASTIAALQAAIRSPSDSGDQIIETASAEDNVDAAVIPGELRRKLVELRDLSEKAERSLADFRKALDESDRFGIGGNNPAPEEIRKTIIEGILAARVVRDEAETDQPRWPVLDLALLALKRTAQNIWRWLGETWADFSSATMAAADTENGRAFVAATEIDLLIKTLEGLAKLLF
jgi:hypothetical protein